MAELIKTGGTRVVLPLPRLGIVLKFSRIKPWVCVRRAYRLIRKFGWRSRKLFLSKTFYRVEAELSFGKMLFSGIHANWMEFWFYLRTRHPLVAPTYFSFLGLINVQRFAFPEEPLRQDVGKLFLKLAYSETMLDGHTLREDHNYGIINRRVKLVDYGGSRTRRILIKYGYIVSDRLDIEARAVAA